MKKIILLLALIMLSVSTSFGQISDKDAVIQTINTFFDGMRKADTVTMRSAIANNMVLQSVGTNKDGATRLITEDISGFLKSVAKPHAQIYDERVVFKDINIDGALASVWAPYKFYLGSQFSHCGVDVFQLVKTNGKWKIIYIVDTRRKDNCPE
ncbi:nuclear transport factor 2 family protein [Mucilaginibacter ginkgonis]|uniref:Nuclear transport factor 2 family protein n=1 Tax=Mucilaginibacter ginkgonis TaxID=2682091 RepID=A0A6I4I0E3_9SPHI|nr:nuclear transport factor 2 family protein [Mucilaginibacter ginkgonis]QQL48579.1 nuclear transport factor 2 family protein [Mucilaginibacter ginkgonis]